MGSNWAYFEGEGPIRGVLPLFFKARERGKPMRFCA